MCHTKPSAPNAAQMRMARDIAALVRARRSVQKVSEAETSDANCTLRARENPIHSGNKIRIGGSENEKNHSGDKAIFANTTGHVTMMNGNIAGTAGETRSTKSLYNEPKMPPAKTPPHDNTMRTMKNAKKALPQFNPPRVSRRAGATFTFDLRPFAAIGCASSTRSSPVAFASVFADAVCSVSSKSLCARRCNSRLCARESPRALASFCKSNAARKVLASGRAGVLPFCFHITGCHNGAT